MIINPKILSIPPFISTSWKNILSIFLENYDTTPKVIVILVGGSRIELPPLDPHIVESIFEAHANYLEVELQASQKNFPIQNRNANETLIPLGFPQFKIGNQGIDNLAGAPLQHNPEQADIPDLPPEVLEKVSAVAKAMGIDDVSNLPKAEPHCNCMHCQIARAIRDEKKEIDIIPEEEQVSSDDLKFRLWDISQKDDKLYIVTNPLDQNEHYEVFLGDTVGCTCGEKNCEHIRAVLNS